MSVETLDVLECASARDRLTLGKIIRELLLTAAVTFTVFLAIHSSIENFRVDGCSTFPTLVDGQFLIANKLLYARLSRGDTDHTPLFAFHPPRRGDVIIMVFPKDLTRDVVKRVIGLPGDVIEIDSGTVIRNGEPLDEPYVVHRDARTFDVVEVAANSYYVLGDNRLVSSDSRHWGFVTNEHIIGRIWYSYWPTDRIEFLHVPW